MVSTCENLHFFFTFFLNLNTLLFSLSLFLLQRSFIAQDYKTGEEKRCDRFSKYP